MKKIELLCVGKLKEDYFMRAVEEYAKRLKRFCAFTVTQLPDQGDGNVAVRAESEAILQRLDGFVVLLDRTGKAVTSEEFAKTIDTAFTVAASKVQVVIGGSSGVNDTVRTRADAVFSFGLVTYPHQLMRVIASEQIYRAMCITNGVRYHK